MVSSAIFTSVRNCILMQILIMDKEMQDNIYMVYDFDAVNNDNDDVDHRITILKYPPLAKSSRQCQAQPS